jgi:hypothetical protein
MRTWRDWYNAHLNSPYWQWVRAALKARATGPDGITRCERCGRARADGVECFHCHHHIGSYRYISYELDHLEKLSYLCSDCHAWRHGHGRDPCTPPSTEYLLELARRL